MYSGDFILFTLIARIFSIKIHEFLHQNFQSDDEYSQDSPTNVTADDSNTAMEPIVFDEEYLLSSPDTSRMGDFVSILN